MNQPAIQLHGIGKSYRIGARMEKYRTLRDSVQRALVPIQKAIGAPQSEALEVDPESLRGSNTAVFTGAMYDDYASRLARTPEEFFEWQKRQDRNYELVDGVSVEELITSLLDTPNLPAPKYVRGIEEVVRGLEQGDQSGRDATGQAGTGGRFELAALVMPATVEHIRAISSRGERMPAKSTYFYPKLLSGLVINPLE